MLISSKWEKETDLSLVIDGIEIDPANNIKVLGITNDQCLKSNKHISNMCSKAGRQLSVLEKSLENIENIQKRALRFVNSDYTSSCREQLTKSGVSGFRIMPLRSLAIEVTECVKQINLVYLDDMFTRKECPYEFRNDELFGTTESEHNKLWF